MDKYSWRLEPGSSQTIYVGDCRRTVVVELDGGEGEVIARVDTGNADLEFPLLPGNSIALQGIEMTIKDTSTLGGSSGAWWFAAEEQTRPIAERLKLRANEAD